LLGNRVPLSLKIFLTALAIIDDLGAILLIAIFYSSDISWMYLGFALGIFVLLIALNRSAVQSLWVYVLPGCVMWFCMQRSGVHPTITGVLLAFTIPFKSGNEASPSTLLQHRLHWPVTFVILPLFALANTAVQFQHTTFSEETARNSLGIIIGLVLGKPVGILLFSWLGLKAGWCVLPHTLKLKHIFAVGTLAGIGFTMSIFIALLAFGDEELIHSSKVAVLTGSLISAIVGVLCLRAVVSKK
jgi:NhaA family Na+:H+ antiporter